MRNARLDDQYRHPANSALDCGQTNRISKAQTSQKHLIWPVIEFIMEHSLGLAFDCHIDGIATGSLHA
jgi:hypothetical protein